jgi:tRNA (cmo5U34)-methyltransferase
MNKIENSVLKNIKKWKFNDEVATIFDYYVEISIPLFNELQRMIAKLPSLILRRNSSVVDLGTATAESILQIQKRNKNKNISYIGMGRSQAILDKASEKCIGIKKCSFYNQIF